MARSTVYNQITSPEKIAQINSENKALIDDFLDYLESVGRAETTIKNYRADLLIFFCWCLDELDNKSFVKVTKREIARFQNHAMKVWGWSSNRLRTVKAALSSLGNYIEAILDEEYEDLETDGCCGNGSSAYRLRRQSGRRRNDSDCGTNGGTERNGGANRYACDTDGGTGGRCIHELSVCIFYGK